MVKLKLVKASKRFLFKYLMIFKYIVKFVHNMNVLLPIESHRSKISNLNLVVSLKLVNNSSNRKFALNSD